MKKCGVCDNCLKQKNVDISNEEFTIITNRIMDSINGSLEIKSLLHQMDGVKREKVWKVLDFLQDEGRVIVDDQGFVKAVLLNVK